MKKPSEIPTSAAEQIKQFQQQWDIVYRAILSECTEKKQAPTTVCIDQANRIDVFFQGMLAISASGKDDYKILHEHLKIIGTELAKLELTTSLQFLQKFQNTLPYPPAAIVFVNLSQTLQKLSKPSVSVAVAAPQKTHLFNIPIEVITSAVVPHLVNRHDVQHLFWTCKFYNESVELLKALQNIPRKMLIAAGSQHMLVCKPEGILYTLGLNQYGQLGREVSTLASGYFPLAITILPAVACIFAGRNHNIALCSNGTLYGWGKNDQGQLGLGHYTNVTTPQQIALPGMQVQNIFGGYNHSFALCTRNADLKSFLYAWGNNDDGHLGVGSTIHLCKPQVVALPEGMQKQNLVSIVGGKAHTLALFSNGSLCSWGKNDQGQLGLSHSNSVAIPQMVTLLQSVQVQHIFAGENHSFALSTDGALYGWGKNDQGQLGLGYEGPCIPAPQLVPIPGGRKVQSVAAYPDHCFALCTDGSIYQWGNYTIAPLLIHIPKLPEGSKKIDQIFPNGGLICQADFTCSIDGALYYFGSSMSSTKFFSLNLEEQSQDVKPGYTSKCIVM